MRTVEIDRQLAEESEQLVEAQGAAAKAAEALAQYPSNPKNRVLVVQAQQRVAEIQVGIDALNAARIEAARYDNSEEVKAIRTRRVAAVDRVEAAQTEVVKAAHAIDEALALLLERTQAFAELRAAASAAAIAYTDLNETDRDTRTQHIDMLIRTPSQLAHALSVSIYHVTQASALDFRNYLNFNPFELTHASGVGGLLVKKVADAAGRNAERVAVALREIEKAHHD